LRRQQAAAPIVDLRLFYAADPLSIKKNVLFFDWYSGQQVVSKAPFGLKPKNILGALQLVT